MPDFSGLPAGIFKKGETLKSKDLQALATAVRRTQLLPNSFQSGSLLLQAGTIPGATAGSAGLGLTRGLLYAPLGPFSEIVDPTSDTPISAYLLSPGISSDKACIPLHFPSLSTEVIPSTDTDPADMAAMEWTNTDIVNVPSASADLGKTLKVRALNYCWKLGIPASNTRFKIVEGFLALIKIPSEEPEEGEEPEPDASHYAFYVLDVITPKTEFRATADSAVIGGPISFTRVDGVYYGDPPEEGIAENPLGWTIDAGGVVLITEGVNEDGEEIFVAINAECPEDEEGDS